MEFNYLEIGERLKTLRKGSGLTQREVAGEFGTKQQIVQGYEKGISRPSSEFIFWAAGYYGVSSDFIIAGISPEEKSAQVTDGAGRYGIGRLTEEENELIRLFREADKTGKAAALAMLKVYQPDKKKKKG